MMKLNSIPLRCIKISDQMWDRYISLVKKSIIPYQWKILNDSIDGIEPSHCIHNFKVAAKEADGEFEGAVFQDTDVAKWLEAVAYSLETSPDPQLEATADSVIELIGRTQQEDGYLNTYFTIKEPELRWKNLEEGHELYTAGHMIEAAVAYYNATGKKRFLQIVSRFADLICTVFGPGENQCHGYPGHQEIELALVKLYRLVGERKYLELAKYFIDQRGVGKNYFLEEERNGKKHIFTEFLSYDPKYSQSHLPVRQQTTAEGHAVRAVYMYCAMADLAYEYQDEELMRACRTLWDNMTHKRMYITGGIGSSGLLERFTTDYDLPNDCNYSETCASIGLALFGRRMMEITKDASYMDVVERALYNNILAGISMDGQKFFYVNPLEVWPETCIDHTFREHVKPVRQTWFGIACCPPNIARTLASLGQYIYAVDENSLYVNLFIGNHTTYQFHEIAWSFDLKSYLPKEGHAVFTVEGSGTAPLNIALRIPEYAEAFQIHKNGELFTDYQIVKGYAVFPAPPQKTTYELRFKQEAVFVRANPKVRADAGKIAIVRGSQVYCLEETDNIANLSSIYIDTTQKITEQFEPDLLGGTITLSLKGKRMKETGWENRLYNTQPVEFEDISLKAVPYSSWNNRKPGEMIVWLKEYFHGN